MAQSPVLEARFVPLAPHRHPQVHDEQWVWPDLSHVRLTRETTLVDRWQRTAQRVGPRPSGPGWSSARQDTFARRNSSPCPTACWMRPPSAATETASARPCAPCWATATTSSHPDQEPSEVDRRPLTSPLTPVSTQLSPQWTTLNTDTFPTMTLCP